MSLQVSGKAPAVVYSLHCDRCHRSLVSASDEVNLLATAFHAGWRRTGQAAFGPLRDVCAQCVHDVIQEVIEQGLFEARREDEVIVNDE